MDWNEANEWERKWHGDCANSYNEETKQFIYARLMGLDVYKTDFYGRLGWNFGDRAILDMGGGPYSLLLKSKARFMTVVDPCIFPHWVDLRYEHLHINLVHSPGEVYGLEEGEAPYDEALLYNCLQHTEDPERIIKNLLSYSRIVRVFEWIDEPLSDGHIHTLTREKMDGWLHGSGKVTDLREGPCVGRAYSGIFRGDHFSPSDALIKNGWTIEK